MNMSFCIGMGTPDSFSMSSFSLTSGWVASTCSSNVCFPYTTFTSITTIKKWTHESQDVVLPPLPNGGQWEGEGDPYSELGGIVLGLTR